MMRLHKGAPNTEHQVKALNSAGTKSSPKRIDIPLIYQQNEEKEDKPEKYECESFNKCKK